MKRNTNICIFLFVIAGLIILFILSGIFFQKERKKTPDKPLPATEHMQESESEQPVIISSKEETVTAYIIRSDEGRLSVYLSDGCTLYMNTGILVCALPAELQETLKDGIRFSNEQELMDFLESYSS